MASPRRRFAPPPPDRKRTLEILRRILAEPTAPFHEHRVRSAIASVLDEAGVRWRLDSSGNLLAAYRRGRARPMALTAHMDHPGLELESVRGRTASAVWNGQIPPFDLRGRRLALWPQAPAERRRGLAVVAKGDGRRPPPAGKTLTLRVPAGARPGDFAHFDLPPFALKAGWIVSKALDNVAGCAAMAAALDHLARRRLPGDVLALFTRAEEVGFHGALGALAEGTIPRRYPAVVLECSKAMPGAEQGLGPVIRVGDRARVFDPDLTAACEQLARELQSRRPGLGFQRRLMDGGACEASAFSLAGYRSVCLAFPLANYHNVGARGIGPERIALKDFLDGVDLLATFAAWGLDPGKARSGLADWVRGRFGPQQARRLAASAAGPCAPSPARISA